MSRIAIFIPTLKSGGAEKQAILLAKALKPIHDIYIIVLHGNETISEANRQLIDESNIGVLRCSGNLFKKILLFKRYLKEKRIEILFNYLTSCDIIGDVVGRMVGVDKIFNGIRNSRLPIHKLVFEQISCNIFSTQTIVNCYSGEEYLKRRGFCAKKLVTIPNCYYELNDIRQRQEHELINIISVGRFVPQKDYNTALKAIGELAKQRKDFLFHIVGYGKLEQAIRKIIYENGIDDIVIIHIAPDNVSQLLDDADIYLSTSKFEGTSNSIMEAMNCSLPIVATDVGDTKYLVENESNGYLVKVADVDRIVFSLSALLDDCRLRNRFGSNGNTKLHNDYNADLFLERYNSLINE